MKTILITGARGFVGRNLSAMWAARGDWTILGADIDTPEEQWQSHLARADVVVHLAGVNRPSSEAEFEPGNVGPAEELCRRLDALGRRPLVLVSSSIQAELDNPYGRAKRRMEESLIGWARRSGARLRIYRLKNVFGKWCRPNYNSVVATFCHNIACDLPITVSDPARVVHLVHIDDVAAAFAAEIEAGGLSAEPYAPVDEIPATPISLGELAGRIQFFRQMQQSLRVPDFAERFNQQLYATFLSYLPPERWEYGLEIKADQRGNLAEFIKSPWFGQIFVSRTLPGITRGNHYHHTKTEKFLVLAGEGLIRFRHIEDLAGRQIIEHRVRGEEYRVVEIPPGWTHSITNVGSGEMITLFWSSELFDPDRPDTYFLPVDPPGNGA